MPWLFDTIGHHCKHPLLVPAVQNSPLNMLCLALRVASPPFDITKLGTSLLIYSRRSAAMCALSQTFSQLEERSSPAHPRTPWMMYIRIDIAKNGFWGGRFEHTFFDVRIFNPHAPFNRTLCCYRKHELEKKRQYEQRVREIEHASFTPLVLSETGGMASEATVFYKRLASCLATKLDQPYSQTMSWLQCRVAFSLLQSGEPVLAVDMQPSPKPHHWTWLFLRQILLK